jgi:hypothetical protein
MPLAPLSAGYPLTNLHSACSVFLLTTVLVITAVGSDLALYTDGLVEGG